MMVAELCLSPMRGLSTLERRDDGLACEGCSDSEPLEALDDELDMVGDKLGRLSNEYMSVVVWGSGYGLVAMVCQL